MRYVCKLVHLLGIAVFFGVLLSVVFNVTNGEIITINPADLLDGHKVRLRSLNLGTGDLLTDYYGIEIQRLEGFDILNGLAVGTGNTKVINGGSLIMIGGGIDNQITSGSSAGIVGGKSNIVGEGQNVVIGGGQHNNAGGIEGAVGGGNGNTISNDRGVILGGNTNDVKYSSIVLGGQSNKADGTNNLLLGTKTRVSSKSSAFVWGDGNGSNYCEGLSDKSATICASKGVLIGRYNGITGVNLVVSGAVKIAGDSGAGTPGEIKMVNGCFYAYDGLKWYIFGRNSKANTDCTNLPDIDLGETCKFGKIELQEGDVVTAYSKPYAKDCNSVMEDNVQCLSGQLKFGSNTEYVYPSCYNVSESPIL